jgi:hypothetical protein
MGLADPKMKAHLADLGGVALPGSPAEFGKLIADEEAEEGAPVRLTSCSKVRLVSREALVVIWEGWVSRRQGFLHSARQLPRPTRLEKNRMDASAPAR